ncbi:MAG: hypothetical protein DIZ80_15170 [endosymbiont of Galathealinum brachiosum]|uniref:Limiting CO2-inducible protein B/C beta carbonyic anhydrase domain-containing protein n=1 Tax=endosymbiont of Galathealinum brachiosum TaxID=2200906 RepID=A0A370DB64_9GAMM|nr:MAG: hypothetical protein DIZ80_15170 [endosymbiont of Galathealinum brachiosum]
MPINYISNFHIDNVAMRYSDFAPRLFNYCLSLGMKANNIMPSRAFCSDENQGFPIILIAKHFATFPFNHGRVGGVVATDRHGPHAQHGKDVVLIQASHVGYNSANNEFGLYRRLQTEKHEFSEDCGAICGVLHWYKEEYDFACQHIALNIENGQKIIIIDNQLLNTDREQGIFLNLDKLINNTVIKHTYSTAKAFQASDELIKLVNTNWPDKKSAFNRRLLPEHFYFKHNTDNTLASGILNHNLIKSMPEIICSQSPELSAAQINTQIEFDRTYRTIIKEKAYRGKKIVFISGLHIDISPDEDQLFPLTKFIPWAAYIQDENGEGYTLEQQDIYLALKQQSKENPHKIDLTKAIHQMEKQAEIKLQVDID